MPRTADPAMRKALVESAARLLALEGTHALTTRRLAAEVGASTMAVYTHFGSMEEIHRAVRREGFTRLATGLDAIGQSQDPVAGLAAVGATYLASGIGEPELYRAMFSERPPEEDEDPGEGIFQRLADTVRRCIDAGRFHQAEPAMTQMWAGQLWTMLHGVVTLALTGLLPHAQVRGLLADMTYRLAVGYGDEPARAWRSVQHASHLQDGTQQRGSRLISDDGGAARAGGPEA